MLAIPIRDSLRGREVLEVACGTRWWTRIMSESARSIMATDLGEEVMEIAKAKEYGCSVTFKQEDAYNLSFRDGSFKGGLAFSWFSHIPLGFIYAFLKSFHSAGGGFVGLHRGQRLRPRNRRRDREERGDPNTYKIGTLKDGGVFTIVKNYFSVEDMVEIFGRHV